MPRPSIAIIGSLNIDFITTTARLPAGGETLRAHSFDTGFGGKGANQAVAAARLAGLTPHRPTPTPADPSTTPLVRMLGNVGDDRFGSEYLDALREEGIDASGVKVLKGQQTGVTNIIVESKTGENRILFVPNANCCFEEHKEKGVAWDLVGRREEEEGREVVVFQLEIPLRVVLHNLALAHTRGQHTILNPAPAEPLPEETFPHISTLIMNESEAALLSQSTVQPLTESALSNATTTLLQTLCEAFLAKGVRECVIITLGAKGLVYAVRQEQGQTATGYIPAERVAKVVDTTAAGDTFVGAYAVRVARGLVGEDGEKGFDFEGAMRFACKAAARSVMKAGAMKAIPYLEELEG